MTVDVLIALLTTLKEKGYGNWCLNVAVGSSETVMNSISINAGEEEITLS